MAIDDPRAALAALATGRGETLSALSRALGRNVAYLQQFVKRGTPVRLDERDRRFLAAHFGVDESVLGGLARAADPMVRVPEFDVTASAGPGALTDDARAIGEHAFAPALLREAGVAPGRAGVIRARGDSMAPTILDGDRLLIDRADAMPGRADAIYVATVEGAVVVKRLSRERDTVTVASDNPAVATRRVPAQDVIVAGRVKLLIRAPR